MCDDPRPFGVRGSHQSPRSPGLTGICGHAVATDWASLALGEAWVGVGASDLVFVEDAQSPLTCGII
jgi:hypothetical protein